MSWYLPCARGWAQSTGERPKVCQARSAKLRAADHCDTTNAELALSRRLQLVLQVPRPDVGQLECNEARGAAD
jgi:hypothetical protein